MMNAPLTFALILSVTLAGLPAFAQDIATTSPDGHQAIKAKIIDANPAQYTINVRTLANFGANENAPTFAVYTSARPPAQCGDFSNLEITYQKPTKYTRVFNLTRHRDVLKAINAYGCVVIKNIPPKAG
jgi:hypothetical protein